MEVWPRLIEHAPIVANNLRDRLTLVAYGSVIHDLPEVSVVPVVPLPGWSGIDAVLMTMDEAAKKG